MSGSSPFPMGFVANMKWHFDGEIPDKAWKSFRTQFSQEHAPGWVVRKQTTRSRYYRQSSVVVSFRTTNPDTAREMSSEQWEFLKAMISLLVTQVKT